MSACLTTVHPTSSPLPPLPSLVFSRLSGQALERQKEYFDCIRNERDELRDELADIKGKAKAAEVGLPKSLRKILIRLRATAILIPDAPYCSFFCLFVFSLSHDNAHMLPLFQKFR